MTLQPTDVLSLRNTGSKRGYPYYGVGVYRPVRRADGKLTYRCVGNYTAPCRSARPEFHGVADHPQYRDGVRHGTPAPEPRYTLADFGL